MIRTVESQYPNKFRSDATAAIVAALSKNLSLELVGMKRVGISNYLRFLLSHKTKLKEFRDFTFIPIDLNDLVEQEILPFWRLTLKRLTDSAMQMNINEELKENISHIFSNSIQFNDLFLTYDAVRDILVRICEAGHMPVIFFIRFDRMKNAVNQDFYNNLKSLKEACGHQLSYIFTSYRPLHLLAPQVFGKSTFVGFTQVIYIKPLIKSDFEKLLSVHTNRLNIKLTTSVKKWLYEITGGHVHYALLCLIVLQERQDLNKLDQQSLYEIFQNDERILMQSEELFSSLNTHEQNRLLSLFDNSKSPGQDDIDEYLRLTGIIATNTKQTSIFSPLFSRHLSMQLLRAQKSSTTLTRKENILFNLLKHKDDKIISREEIAHAVWPEYKEIGVSDWSMDRLVFRLRKKLKKMEGNFEIKTIRTRGFKLIKK